MRIDASRGTFEDIANLVPANCPISEAVRSLVAELDPDATEAANPRERIVYWATGAGQMGESFAYASPHKAHVNLGFFDGVRLPDPEGLLEGTGKILRPVRLRALPDVAKPATRALLTAARDKRRAAVNPQESLSMLWPIGSTSRLRWSRPTEM